MTRRILFIAVAFITANCGNPKLVKAACRKDTDCESGLLCEDFRCVDQKTRACQLVTDGNPILQPSPYAVALGDVDRTETETTVSLNSIGNCSLTIYEASIKGQNSPFSCTEFCGGKFPIEIFPGREEPVKITFKTSVLGKYDDMLRILSDDREFPEMNVPLHANFIGVPLLKAAPNPVDFGYVASGKDLSRAVTLTNQGTGIAPIEIKSIKLKPAETMDFALDLASLTFPFKLVPIATDFKATAVLNVRYTPRSAENHTANLVIETAKGDVTVPLKGNAETPPKIEICAAGQCLVANNTMPSLNLGDVPYGSTNVLPLSIQNKGGAPLNVTYKWDGAVNTDLSASPAGFAPINSGGVVELKVAYSNSSGKGAVSGTLAISSNDTSRPLVNVPITANATPPAGPEVVKLEMFFENGSDGIFDNDLRNVDLRLEHPFGYVCDKAHPDPTNWGGYGNPSWLSFPPKEEPERIILPGAMMDGTYKVQLSYIEDCSSVPSALLASLLGISLDVLLAYLTNGIGVVDPRALADFISKICISRSAANATVRAFVNGTLIKEKTVPVVRKGDSIYAMELVRTNGKFSAR